MIIAEVGICATYLDAMNRHGRDVERDCNQFLATAAADITPEKRQSFSEETRRTIRAHDDASKENIPRCIHALQWCNCRGRAQEVPHADVVCAKLKAALTENQALMTQTLPTQFEIMRAASGSTLGYKLGIGAAAVLAAGLLLGRMTK